LERLLVQSWHCRLWATDSQVQIDPLAFEELRNAAEEEEDEDEDLEEAEGDEDDGYYEYDESDCYYESEGYRSD